MASRATESALLATVGATILLAPLTELTWWQAPLVVLGTLGVSVLLLLTVTSRNRKVAWLVGLPTSIVVGLTGWGLFRAAIDGEVPAWCGSVGGWLAIIGIAGTVVVFSP